MYELKLSEQNFLGVDASAKISLTDADAIIIPFGLEKTVSYGGGTAGGPRAIIDASSEVELFDEDFLCEPTQHLSIVTAQEPEMLSSHTDCLLGLERLVSSSLAHDLFPLVLGGEHSLTSAALKPFLSRYDEVVVLHFDAHADLRESYDGSTHSHACAMRRCLDFDNVSLISVGIRNISSAEFDFYQGNRERVSIFWAKNREQWDLSVIRELLRDKTIYLSFDVDGFDSSIMPATGTPEPGGFFWYDAIKIIDLASKAGRIVGADVTELSPLKGFSAPNFLAAKLAYKIIAFSLLNAR